MPSESSSTEQITSQLRVISPPSYGLFVKERVKKLECDNNPDTTKENIGGPESVINVHGATIGYSSASKIALKGSNIKEKRANTLIAGKASSKKSRIKVPREICPFTDRPGTLPRKSSYGLVNNRDRSETDVLNQKKGKNCQTKITRNDKTLPIVNASLEWIGGDSTLYTTKNCNLERCSQSKPGNVSPPPLQQPGIPSLHSTKERNCLSAEASSTPLFTSKLSYVKKKNSFFHVADDDFYNPRSGSAKGETIKHIRVTEFPTNISSVNIGKQWEFRMPKTDHATCPETKFGESTAGQQPCVDSTFTGPRNSTALKPKHRRVCSHPSFISDTTIVSQSGKGVAVQHSKIGPKKLINTKVQTATDVPLELVISGKQQLGTIGEDTSTTYALASLESAVARERRLLEELSDVRKKILTGFRSIVQAFISNHLSQNEPLDSCLTTMNKVAVTTHRSSITSVTGASYTFTHSVPLARVKCSVVVHTLATTIQQYARYRNSCYLASLIHMGDGASAPAMTLSFTTSSLDMTSCTGTNSEDGTSVNSALKETNRSHEDGIDSSTISQLKQLYFAYYDCESYVFDNADDISPSAHRLSVGVGKDISNVIDEENVLLLGMEEGKCDGCVYAVDSILEDIVDDTTLEENGEYNIHLHTPTYNMIFDKDREICHIYSEDDEAETDSDSCEDHENEIIGHLCKSQSKDDTHNMECRTSASNDLYTDISEEYIDEVKYNLTKPR